MSAGQGVAPGSGVGLGPVPAAAIAAAVTAARALMRLSGEEEAALLASVAAAAIGLAEAFVGQPLLIRGVEEVLTPSGAWQPLTATPVKAIDGVTAVPVGAAPWVLAVDGYAVDIDAQGRGWLRLTAPLGQPGAFGGRVAVQYTAGLAAEWDALPAPIAQGVVLLIAHLFENRASEAAPPSAVAALWRPWRRLRLVADCRTGVRA